MGKPFLGQFNEDFISILLKNADFSNFSTKEEIVNRLCQLVPIIAGANQKYNERFTKSLRKTWGGSLDQLEAYSFICFGKLEEFRLRFASTKDLDNDQIFFVLILLHARAVEIAREIVTLLSSGFSDGALGRWRTMSEIGTTALFIKLNGEDAAQAYLDHIAFEKLKRVQEYNQFASSMNLEGLSDEKEQQLRSRLEDLKKKHHNNEFDKMDGWAIPFLRKMSINGNGKTAMEKAVGQNDRHLFVRMAGGCVHSGVDGTIQKIGLRSALHGRVASSGPSNYGLDLPGYLCAVTLNEINCLTLNYWRSGKPEDIEYNQMLDNFIIASKEFIDSIGHNLMKADQLLKENML